MIGSLIVALALFQERPFRFTLATRDEKDRSYEIVRIYDSAGKLVWKKSYEPPIYPKWSPDRKALAWLDQSMDLHTWQSTGVVRNFRIRNPFSDGYGEPPGFENYPKWSPDGKRLLLKIPGVQGDFDTGIGALVYANVITGKNRSISENASDVAWIDARTVRYSDVILHELPQAPTVRWHRWHARD